MSTHAVPMAVYAGQASSKQKQLSISSNKWLQKSLVAGNIIFIAGGMDLALGLGWNKYTRIETTKHFQFCWFIGAIIGAILATPFIPLLSKRFYMRSSAFLMIVTGIIYLAAPTTYGAIIAARYISGVALGWAAVAFVVHASEIAFPKYRGSCLAPEQYAISIGMCIQIIYASQWTLDIHFAANRLHGIIVLILGVLAFGFTWFIIESPIFYIRKNEEQLALACQQRLLCRTVLDDATLFTLEDNKNYVLENENRTIGECLVEAAIPTLKILIYRSFVAFTFSLPLSCALQLSSFIALGYENGWPAIVFAVLRMITALSSIYLLDYLGRKLISLFSLFIVAAMSISIGGIYSNLYDEYDMAIACTLSLVHQIFAGFFVPSTSVYLGEAFPMRIKPYLIACCYTWEYLIHIIVICTFTISTQSIYKYLVSVGVLMLFGSGIFIVLLPETRRSTLREAQDRFRRLYDCKFY